MPPSVRTTLLPLLLAAVLADPAGMQERVRGRVS
jgi:hypothetical protein